MDGNKRNFLNKLSSPQFKKKGGIRNANLNYPNHEPFSEKGQASDTVYHILCPSKKIGSVIEKGGNIIKSLREETKAKITVADSVPGSDERVIIISRLSKQLAGRINSDRNNENQVTREESKGMEPRCAAQDALLKIHYRIVEEDLGGAADGNSKEIEVITRLLVANNLVGCLLGKKGDVIQRSRSETGASIRVLPTDHLPACAMATDVLVQGGAREYDFPDFPGSTRYPTIRSPQMKIPNHSYASSSGTGLYGVSEVAVNRSRFQDPHSVRSGFHDDIPGSSDHLNAGQNIFQGFGSSAGQSSEIQPSAYHHSYNTQQSGYQNYNAQGSYSSISPSQLPYQNVHPHQAPYRIVNS